MLSDNTEEVVQHKLLLLYIIKLSPKSYTKEELTEFILDKNYMNYFTIQQYLGELLEGEFISIENDEKKYAILEKGEVILNYFIAKISPSIIEELEQEFKLQQIIAKKETQVIAEYFQKENDQYTVNLKLVENEDTLFSLYIEVPTIEQATEICEKWKDNTQSIYQNIINMLI